MNIRATMKGWTHTHTGTYEREPEGDSPGQRFSFPLYKLGAAGYRAHDKAGTPFCFLDGSLNQLNSDVGPGEKVYLSIERARPAPRRPQRDSFWHERALERAKGPTLSPALLALQQETLARVRALPRPGQYRRLSATWGPQTPEGVEWMHEGPPYRADPETGAREGRWRPGSYSVEIQVRRGGVGPWIPVLLRGSPESAL